jgi:hypothetical protein
MDDDFSDDVILAEGRERFARGEPIRGLPKPSDAPAESWWSVQRRDRGGTYLYLRWRDFGRLRARSLGRLDNATA